MPSTRHNPYASTLCTKCRGAIHQKPTVSLCSFFKGNTKQASCARLCSIVPGMAPLKEQKWSVSGLRPPNDVFMRCLQGKEKYQSSCGIASVVQRQRSSLLCGTLQIREVQQHIFFTFISTDTTYCDTQRPPARLYNRFIGNKIATIDQGQFFRCLDFNPSMRITTTQVSTTFFDKASPQSPCILTLKNDSEYDEE
ncbi:MAG: hypothetical protein J3R72DRAFT_239521 [Linnemannia gamsii]|nr:MAG: hypothetical protein J3R72DRAFT_239521 [Linnemannia gamsii]